jgi:tripartite-type tricarboxylate transporter receptor subunit TctC
MIMTRCLLAAYAAAVYWLAGNAPAIAKYPERPIRVVLGFPAGGGADILARYYTEELRKLSGAAIVVENKPGASGNLSLEQVARAKPDGYTLLMASTTTLAGNSKMFKKVPFDSNKDFEPIASLNEVAFALLVAPEHVKASSVDELTAHLKAKGPKATFGWATTTALAAAVMYGKAKGLTLTPVPYKVTTGSISDVVAGLVDFGFADTVYAAAQERQGKVKALAVTSGQRVPGMPSVPPLPDHGVDTANLSPLWAFWAPAATPREIIAMHTAWLNRIVETPATQQFLLSQGATPVVGGPDLMRRKLAEALVAWGAAVEAGNITLQ